MGQPALSYPGCLAGWPMVQKMLELLELLELAVFYECVLLELLKMLEFAVFWALWLAGWLAWLAVWLANGSKNVGIVGIVGTSSVL